MARIHRQIPFAVFLLLCILLTILLYVRPLEGPASSTGKAFPNITLPVYIEGSEIISEYRIYNFFASWCAPCIAEIPYLDLLEQLSGQPIYGIAWDRNLPKLQEFLDNHGNPFHAVYLDSRGKLAAALQVTGLPETFIVDSNNEIVWHLRGPITRKEYDEIKTLLNIKTH